MQTSEILNRAADLIEERGWRTGEWGTNEVGAPLCLEGGILAALDSDWETVEVPVFQRCPAYTAVRTYLDLKPRVELWSWNDETNRAGDYIRTAADVIATLRAAALIEAARENTEARGLVSAP